MKRIYYRLNWKNYLKDVEGEDGFSGHLKHKGDIIYRTFFKQIKSASARNLKELCISIDDYSRTMIVVSRDEYAEVLEMCMMYFQTKEEYEQCIEIRNLIQKIKTKKLSSKINKKEKLILMKLSPVMREE
jgi:hypothetical protein